MTAAGRLLTFDETVGGAVGLDAARQKIPLKIRHHRGQFVWSWNFLKVIRLGERISHRAKIIRVVGAQVYHAAVQQDFLRQHWKTQINEAVLLMLSLGPRIRENKCAAPPLWREAEDAPENKTPRFA